MKVTFWGVKGSIAGNGKSPSVIGSNTACITVEINKTLIILDAGTGLHQFSHQMPSTTRSVLLLSHLHWDHIVGLPFFRPLFNLNTTTIILNPENPKLDTTIKQLFDPVHFPVAYQDLASPPITTSGNVDQYLPDDIKVTYQKINHTTACFAFRIEHQGKCLVYCTDNEIELTNSSQTETFKAFYANADVLIHDAQYIESERDTKTGWGHSFVDDVAQIATQCQVKTAYLFHHDPTRSDEELTQIEADTQARFQNTQIRLAREGHTLTL